MITSHILSCEILNYVQLIDRLLQSIITSTTQIKEILILYGLVFPRIQTQLLELDTMTLENISAHLFSLGMRS